MFKKLVSHLKFSPSLISELADLANRLRVQNPVRVIGVASLGLLLVVQVVLYINPPIGSSQTYEGSLLFDSSIQQSDVANQIDSNYRSLGNILNTLNIDSTHISQASLVDNPSPSKYRLSRWPVDETSIDIRYGNSQFVYLTPLLDWGRISDTEQPFIHGKSSSRDAFSISTTSGSMYIDYEIENVDTTSPIHLGITYENTSTQSSSTEPLKPGDRVKFTLRAINTSEEPLLHTFRLPLGDAFEYMTTATDESSDPRVGEVNKEAVWSEIEIQPNSQATREIILRTKSTISNLPQNPAHPYSQDCTVTVIHGNQIDLPIECGIQKELEMFTSARSKIDQGTLLIATTLIFLTTLLLAIKALQEEEEIRIIRHKFNSGA